MKAGYIAWYNNERIHSHLDYLSPNELELNYWQQIVNADKITKSQSNYFSRLLIWF